MHLLPQGEASTPTPNARNECERTLSGVKGATHATRTVDWYAVPCRTYTDRCRGDRDAGCCAGAGTVARIACPGAPYTVSELQLQPSSLESESGSSSTITAPVFLRGPALRSWYVLPSFSSFFRSFSSSSWPSGEDCPRRECFRETGHRTRSSICCVVWR